MFLDSLRRFLYDRLPGNLLQRHVLHACQEFCDVHHIVFLHILVSVLAQILTVRLIGRVLRMLLKHLSLYKRLSLPFCCMFLGKILKTFSSHETVFVRLLETLQKYWVFGSIYCSLSAGGKDRCDCDPMI